MHAPPPSASLPWLADRLRAGGSIVFSGAGMSTESGLPDFRGANGLWRDRSVEELACPAGMERDFAAFTAFYRWRVQTLLEHQPHRGHELLATWQREGRIGSIVTQNVDGYHQAAGAERVIELHGSLRTVRCQRCAARVAAADYLADGQEWCPCGGKRRPDLVLFGEGLDPLRLETAFTQAGAASFMLVLGSALLVSPANQLPGFARQHGAAIAVVNRDPVPVPHDWYHPGPIGEVLAAVAAALPG